MLYSSAEIVLLARVDSARAATRMDVVVPSPREGGKTYRYVIARLSCGPFSLGSDRSFVTKLSPGTPQLRAAIGEKRMATLDAEEAKALQELEAEYEKKRTELRKSFEEKRKSLGSSAVGGMKGLGPRWTRGEIEAPAASRSMGSYTVRVYTEEQQARLGVDELGAKKARHVVGGAGGMPPFVPPRPSCRCSLKLFVL